jgi:hypothetical protein
MLINFLSTLILFELTEIEKTSFCGKWHWISETSIIRFAAHDPFFPLFFLFFFLFRRFFRVANFAPSPPFSNRSNTNPVNPVTFSFLSLNKVTGGTLFP